MLVVPTLIVNCGVYLSIEVASLIEGQIPSWQFRKALYDKGLVDFQLSGFTDFTWSWLTGKVRNNPFHRSTIIV